MNLKLGLSVPLMVISLTFSAQAEVIYQAFDDPYTEIEARLPEIQALGYTTIQISPPQKSHPADIWWANYQPIDWTVLENRLGNEPDLIALIERAHDLELKILVDTVLNHMANVSPYIETLEYPQFSAIHFHPRQCIDYDNRPLVLTGWVGCDLPDLRTRSPYVRQQAQTFIQSLLDLGVDGFRFDSAKHIEPDFFTELEAMIPPDRFTYGEIIGESLEESQDYTPLFPVTDYHLYGTMVDAFKPQGDLRTLIHPHEKRRALPPSVSVRFARNHDIVKNEDFYRFSEPNHPRLANAYLLSTGEGYPFIFDEDATDPITQAGVQFHHQMIGESLSYPTPSFSGDLDDLLLIQRGDRGLVILHKGQTSETLSGLTPLTLSPGNYQELQSGDTFSWGDDPQPSISILPESVLLFVKQDEPTP